MNQKARKRADFRYKDLYSKVCKQGSEGLKINRKPIG
jgi:hypothetical protein